MELKKKDLVNLAVEVLDWMGIQLSREKWEKFDQRWKRRWYDEWMETRDLHFYEHRFYPFIALICFEGWSHASTVSTLKFLEKTGMQPETILDVGAGAGLTTAMLALALPDTLIYYQNLRGPQFRLAKEIMRRLEIRNVRFCYAPSIPQVDMVCAFEFLEHIRDPYPILEEMLGPITQANLFSDVAGFNLKEVGHWPEFLWDDELVGCEKIRYRINKRLREWGWQSADKALDNWPKRFWNNRPAMWVR